MEGREGRSWFEKILDSSLGSAALCSPFRTSTFGFYDKVWHEKLIDYLLCSPLSDIPGDLLGAGEAPVPAEVTFLLSHRHQVGRVHCRVHHLIDKQQSCQFSSFCSNSLFLFHVKCCVLPSSQSRLTVLSSLGWRWKPCPQQQARQTKTQPSSIYKLFTLLILLIWKRLDRERIHLSWNSLSFEMTRITV